MRRIRSGLLGLATKVGLLAVTGGLIVLAGCGSQRTERSSDTAADPRTTESSVATTVDTQQTTSTTTASPQPELASARHPECAERGSAVHRFLMTGDSNGDPTIEDRFGDDRSEVADQPPESLAPLAVAGANLAIAECDAAVDEEDLMAQQANAAAAQQQQAIDQANAWNAFVAAAAANYAEGCRIHGGYLDDLGACAVDYPGWITEYVPLNPDGTLNRGVADSARGTCELYLEFAQRDAAQGFPWLRLPVYHPDSGVCVPGEPG